MKKTFISALALASALAAMADEHLWLRNTALSPDGSTIAFTYHGDIFTVPVAGGPARQITSSRSYDSYPVWSPDGRTLAFASDRRGGMDVYVTSAEGGTPRRLTTHSLGEVPLAFLNDSTLLFSASMAPSRLTSTPDVGSQVYEVPLKGGRPKMLASVSMGAMSVGPNGRILYHDKKGFENKWRKHERSSGTSDIWLLADGAYTKLTDFNGHDLEPVWAGKDAFYYVSEKDGTLNIYRRSLASGTDTQLTGLTRHPVRSLSASADGKLLAYSWNGEIYTLRPGEQPKKVKVEITADDYDSDLLKGYRQSGATSMTPSPSGEEVAFVMRGDVYVTSVKYKTTKQITNTDGQERCVSFSPDGRTLVYDSERDGKWQLFTSKIKNDDEKLFTYATEIVEEPLYSSERTAQQPEFSPDGKKVAFLEDRTELRVIDLATKAVNTALDGKYNYSYADGDVPFTWSPDSRWLLVSYIGVGGWNNADIALVAADGSSHTNLTETGYSVSNPKWVLGGKAVAFNTGRYGYKSHGSWGEQDDVVMMVLDPEAWDDFNLSEEDAALKEKADSEKSDKSDSSDKSDKSDKKKKGKKGKEAKADDEPKPLVFDLPNRHYRTKRLTAMSSNLADFWLDPKGEHLYYITQAPDGSFNLMSRDMKKGDVKTVAASVGYGGLNPDKKGENLYLITGSGMKKISVPGGEVKSIDFEAPFSRHPSAERAYIFDHAHRQVADKFYDANIHGIDWDGYAADYRRFLPHVNNNYDFAIVLSELLGELNASHTGARYYGPSPALAVADLGAFFDPDYEEDGLKVAEVLPRGPLSTKSANVQAGDIIVSIDGADIKAGEDYNALLEGKAGRKVRLGVRKPSGKIEYAMVKPVGGTSDLLYQRWVERNEAIVDSVSGGRVAYVHVQGMDSPSFREVYSKLLGKYRNHEAVVVDTRYNGGGWLHNDIALLLSGKEYVRYAPRGRYIGSDPFSQWTKPSVMLVNEANYSDAHGTPYTYKTLGIGKVVGAPVPGTMTAVWWETQIDPTIVFGIPQVTSLDRNGKPLENQQLDPDVLVYDNPGDVQRGQDDQLVRATLELLNTLDNK